MNNRPKSTDDPIPVQTRATGFCTREPGLIAAPWLAGVAAYAQRGETPATVAGVDGGPLVIDLAALKA